MPGVTPFVFLSLVLAVWAIADALEDSAIDFATTLFWFQVQAALELPIFTLGLCFALDYAGLTRWLTRRNLTLLFVPPVLVALLIYTNDFHHLAFTRISVGEYISEQRGVGSWIAAGYASLLFLIEVGVFVWIFKRSPVHRWWISMLIVGQVAVSASYAVDAVGLNPLYPLDETVIVGGIVILAYSLALFQFHLFGVVRAARNMIVEQMDDGMVVVNMDNRIADLNHSSERMLNVTKSQMIGRDVAEALQAEPALDLLATSNTSANIEICIGTGAGAKYYQVYFFSLMNPPSRQLGRVMVFHDITESKRAQENLLEQQTVRAVLEERAGLARELHDSIDQALAAAQLQAETADELIDRGEIAAAQDTLSRLVEVTQSAHVDIQQYLLGAMTLLTPGEDVFVALHEYVKQFGRDFGIPTELVIAQGMKEQGLDSQARVQLIRIVQEGLANVRKHAHASTAQVVFTLNAGRIQVRIEDDGVGFDVARYFKVEGQRFGLRSMRDRAKGIGGTFQILSEPGRGTRVIVEVPCENASAGLGWTDVQPAARDNPQGDASSEQRALDRDHPVPSD